jgi:hypothetical protein
MPGFNPFPSLLFRFEAVNLFPGKEPEVPRELNRQTMITLRFKKESQEVPAFIGINSIISYRISHDGSAEKKRGTAGNEVEAKKNFYGINTIFLCKEIPVGIHFPGPESHTLTKKRPAETSVPRRLLPIG